MQVKVQEHTQQKRTTRHRHPATCPATATTTAHTSPPLPSLQSPDAAYGTFLRRPAALGAAGAGCEPEAEAGGSGLGAQRTSSTRAVGREYSPTNQQGKRSEEGRKGGGSRVSIRSSRSPARSFEPNEWRITLRGERGSQISGRPEGVPISGVLLVLLVALDACLCLLGNLLRRRPNPQK